MFPNMVAKVLEGLDPQDDIMDIVDYIAHVHIKDKLEGKGVWNFPAIGEGYIDFNNLFDVLYNNNFSGPFSFEIEFIKQGPKTPEEVDLALKKSVKYISQLKSCNWDITD
jgi:sugar phosphate isomerase/epimerase